MFRPLAWVAAGLVLAATSCSRAPELLTAPATGAINAPTSPSGLSSQAALGPAIASGQHMQSALAIYTLQIDPASLTAVAALRETRTAQANDDLYLLPIDSFLRADSFRVTGLTADAENLHLAYQIAHPFPAALDPAGTPNGSTNRADLGIAGMALFLTDVPSASGHTFFTDVVANTELVSNADAYYRPAGLLSLSSSANTFPYRLLIDESGPDGNRVGIPNGGDPTGNFGADGWSRAEMGATAPFDKWTGYGVLHQGQVASNTVSLNRAALAAAGSFSLDVAVLAKYNDPRFGATPAAKKANRLPAATPDALSSMAYRMPHGALDVQRVELLEDTGGFITDQISSSTLSFRVEDWDARATSSAETDLAEEADVTRVAAGEEGLPTLALCIPGVLGDATVIDAWTTGDILDDDTPYGGDAAADSGRPGDALVFSKMVTKTVTSGQTSGFYTGMIRATDPESLLADPNFVIELDGTLTPLTSNVPEPVTYQAFLVTLQSLNAAPTATVDNPATTVVSGNGQLTLVVSAYNDPDGDPLQIRFDWNNDGDYLDTGEGYQNLDGTPPDSFVSPIFYNNPTLTPTATSVPWEVTDNIVLLPASGTATFTLGPNQAPVVSGLPAVSPGSAPAPATFSITAGTATATDPEGDTVSYLVTASTAPAGPFPGAAGQAAFPISGVGPYPTNGVVNFTVYARDALHGNLVPAQPDSASSWATLSGVVGSIPGWVWTGISGSSATLEWVQGIAVGGSGNVYLIVRCGNGGDLGGGATTADGVAAEYLVKLDPSGNYINSFKIDIVGGFEQTGGLALDASENVYVGGMWRGTGSFGGPSRTNNGTVSSFNYDVFVAKYNSSLTYQWDWFSSGDGSAILASVSNPEGRPLAVNPATGDVFLTGQFTRNEEFGLGPVLNAGGATASTNDAFVVKLNASGVPQWNTSYTMNSTTTEGGFAIAVDAAGNVYNGGTYATGADFGGGARTSVLSASAYVTKLNGATGAWIWDQVFGSATTTGTEAVYALAVDGTNVYAAGRYYPNTDFGGGARTGSGTGAEGCVVAYNANTGAYAWDRTFTGSVNTDATTNIFVQGSDLYAGGFWAATVDFGGGGRVSNGGNDAYVVKLTTSGTYVYDRTWGSTGADQVRGAMFVDATGGVFLGGQYVGTVDFDPGAGVVNRSSFSAAQDWWALKMNGATGSF